MTCPDCNVAGPWPFAEAGGCLGQRCAARWWYAALVRAEVPSRVTIGESWADGKCQKLQRRGVVEGYGMQAKG